MIKFSDDDEEFLDRIRSPPESPPLSDDEADEKTKTLWYNDKSSHDNTISISLQRIHGKHSYLAGETIEVEVTCTVRKLQLLSGVLEGFCVADGIVEDTFLFHEVRLFPSQHHCTPQPVVEEKARRGSFSSVGTTNESERRFKFCITIPPCAPPSLKVNSKNGIFYRVLVCGIGEVHHLHVLPHKTHNDVLSPTRDASPHIGGVSNFVPFRVRNNTCKYMKNILLDKPQTSFSVTAPVSGKDITLKAHLVGSAPYAVLGQRCTFFVKVENATVKYTKGFTIKLVRNIHTVSTSHAFIKCTDEEDPLYDKCKTILKFKFHASEYHCSPKSKLTSQLSFLIPHNLTPTIHLPNLQATYGLVVRVDVSPSHGLSRELPVLVLPSLIDEQSRSGIRVSNEGFL